MGTWAPYGSCSNGSSKPGQRRCPLTRLMQLFQIVTLRSAAKLQHARLRNGAKLQHARLRSGAKNWNKNPWPIRLGMH